MIMGLNVSGDAAATDYDDGDDDDDDSYNVDGERI